MFNERAFIARVESAGPQELASILARPKIEEEKALRAHLGDERYQRMRDMALKRNMNRSVTSQPKGNVVVIHGIMGAELSVTNGGAGDLTWVNAFRIMRGWLERLRLGEDGRTDFNSQFKVRASGIMKRYYGELILSLAENWNVHAFWFDWRKDLDLAADELNVQINGWFEKGSPVHIVAHSMGGLVARTFIKKYPERWASMWDKNGQGGKSGGRLVMLGTPNHGSFAIPQVITGVEGLVRKLALLDVRHTRHGLLETLNSFVGSYQMLPSPLVMESMKDLYKSGTYGGYNVPQRHLDNALRHHQFLSDVIDGDRMIYVAGYDQPTPSNIKDWKKLDSPDGYEVTVDGDGRVPHQLGLLKRNGSLVVPTFYIRENHGNLSSSAKILSVLDELLETGKTDDLPQSLPANRSMQTRGQDSLQQALQDQLDDDEARIKISLGRMGTRSVDPDAVAFDHREEPDVNETIPPQYISPEQRKVEESVMRGFLAYRGDDEQPAAADEVGASLDEGIESATIEIGLIYGGIESIPYDQIKSDKGDPVDCVAVGHYIGVQPAAAELKLDKAISKFLLGRAGDKDFDPPKSDLILTQYTERGTIHGKLGQPFFMPDPRPARDRKGQPTTRLIALAGMDEPGRFGGPELTVLVRELCWSLGRMKRRHLATVLIGTGAGNLDMRDALSSWMSGIRRALTGSRYDAVMDMRLPRITFVEFNPRRVRELSELISQERDRGEKEGHGNSGLRIVFKEPSAKELERVKRDEKANAERAWRESWSSKSAGQRAKSAKPSPVRVSLSLDALEKTYRFGAISDAASVAERDIKIDPEVVMQANNELAGEQQPAMQLERGRFLEELLIPDDLRRQLYNNAPLVMILDSTTARIHWEMVAQPVFANAGGGAARGGVDGKFEYEDNFLGTSRGFTRQLRTTFAPPPEPPPPPRRVLRVLVVADPAEDAHLPGAQEEGVTVADLFESYNVIYKDKLDMTRVEVVRLFGPLEATRTNVLRELMIRQYDVLHFAGHCVYQWGGDPTLSGWIFNAKKKEVLSANELSRIDRVPKFVFSNACESGITPDRSQDRSVDLAPSFAEAFFARGVANFVCTAWPVDDLAARMFALTLYSNLLGIELGDAARRPERRPEGARSMLEAMREARVRIASTPNGRTTWGAYQHYGNPYFLFFYSPETQQTPDGTRSAPAARSAGKKSGVKGAAKSAAKKSGAVKKAATSHRQAARASK
jgi:pimeloyl-ACP methyl ester carboxylesterase